MNKSDTNRPLSPSVEARKEEMLFGLQSELALFHRGRKRKRMVAGSLAAGAAVLLVGLSLLDFGGEETMVQSNDIAEEQIRQDQPLVKTPLPYVVTVGNNDKVREKYIVEKFRNGFSVGNRRRRRIAGDACGQRQPIVLRKDQRRGTPDSGFAIRTKLSSQING